MSHYAISPGDAKFEQELENQPFFVIEDKSHARMMAKLNNGEKNTKSYYHPCTHNEANCKCKFFLNYLNEDGEMVRMAGGKEKYVFSAAQYKRIMESVVKRK